MDELLVILEEHTKRYPHLTSLDLLKLVYQNEFGPGHFITDEGASLKRLEVEVQQLGQAHRDLLFEDIGNDLMRLHLNALGTSLSLKTVNRFFTLTAQEKQGSVESFEDKLQILLEHYPSEELRRHIKEHKDAGYPPFSHSETYRKQYAPSYRVVKADFARYFPVFQGIEQLLREKEQVIVAIDGRSGAGKSFLGSLLSAVYDCQVVSMDHFFLRPQQRTPARLQEPGGNVDYERFQAEVISKLKDTQPFSYRIYNCQTNSYSSSPLIEPQRLVVVEGSYSHHPILTEHYDLKVFLTIPAPLQRERILERNGPKMLKRFVNEWIPLEELYFTSLEIQEKSDVIIDTNWKKTP